MKPSGARPSLSPSTVPSIPPSVFPSLVPTTMIPSHASLELHIVQLVMTVEDATGQAGWTISSVDGESQQGGFVDSGTTLDAVLLQHGSYVFDMTVDLGSANGEFHGVRSGVE